MIDLHSHVLPGIDDGAADLDEALAMLGLARDDGIGTMVGTPHFDGADREFPALCAARLAALRQATSAGPAAVEVLLGFEVSLTPAILEWGADLRTLAINGGHYLLVELPLGFWPPYLHDVVFQLQMLGMRPILAHAERYEAIGRDPAYAADLVGRGVLLQVNGDSLLGKGGSQIQRCARTLVERELVSFLSSDAHSPRRRPPRLRAAAEVVARLAGPEVADQLVNGNPAAVVADTDLPPAPRYRRQRRFFNFPAFRRGT